MTRKLCISGIIILLLFFTCSEDQQDEDSKVTITFWHSFVSSTIPALNALVEKFEQDFPDIKIKTQYVPTGDALIQKLITAVQSQTAPDISWLHADFMQDLVEAEAIYEMNRFVEGPDSIPARDMADIYPPLIQYASWRGTLYSMPMEATNIALIYNKEMFREAGLDPEKPPATWQELHEFARKLTLDRDADGKLEQTGFFLPIFPAAGPLAPWMVWQWMPFLWQAGGYMIDTEQTHVLYDSPAGIAALKLWQEIYNDLQLSTFTTDYDMAFASKRLAMAMDGPWNLPRFTKLLSNLDWAFAPLPAGPQKRATIVGGEYLAIFKQSNHPDEAWKFIKWMIKPDVQAFWSMKSGYMPIRRAATTIPEFITYMNNHSNFKVFVDQMEYGQAQRPIDYYNLQITRHVAQAIEKVMVGKSDPEKTLQEAAQQSNRLLRSVNKE